MEQFYSFFKPLRGRIMILFALMGMPVAVLAQFQTFTSSGNFTVPANVTSISVEVWGGGGRGATMSAAGAGGGGGGGAYSRSILTVVPGTTYSFVVGSGSNSASPGGDTWFGTSTTVMAKGGSSAANDSALPGAGGQAALGVGDVTFSGGSGFNGSGTNAGGGGSSAGSSSPGNSASGSAGAIAPNEGGNGGAGRVGSSGNGIAGTVFGGAGGGAYRFDGGVRVGGAGASGLVRVSWDGPEINVYGNSISITAGDNTPSLTDGTDFGSTPVAVAVSSQFFIENAGAAALTISDVTISGTDAADFSISAYPSATTNPASSTFLVIHFTPSSEGAKSALVTITNNDSNEGSFTFSIAGTATGIDADGDGVPADEDCDDSNPDIFQLDVFYVDADSDGYGTGETALVCYGLDTPEGYLLALGELDCDDSNAAIGPGSPEVLYNGIDDNCDGELDEGNQIRIRVRDNQCGTTLGTISQVIFTNWTASIEQTTRFRYRVTKIEEGIEVGAPQIYERAQYYFHLTNLASYEYASTYRVEVELQRNGVWLGYYGDPCLVSTPAVLDPDGATQVVSDQCGQTLPTLSTIVHTTSLLNVSGYKFRVTNQTDPGAPGQVQEIERVLPWFSLTMLPYHNYGTTYAIEVALKTTDGYSQYGATCLVSTPEVPMITSCGQTLASPSAFVYTTSRNRTQSYRFELALLDEMDFPVSTQTIDRPVQYFNFSMVPNYVPGGKYQIRVALRTADWYSPYGEPCYVNAPAMGRFDGSVEIKNPDTVFRAVAYPNPYSEGFSLDVDASVDQPIRFRVFDMTGKMLDDRLYETSEIEYLKFGERYPSGVYNVVLSQGSEIRTLRLVKR